jgi:hypothetical protein
MMLKRVGSSNLPEVVKSQRQALQNEDVLGNNVSGSTL